MKELEKYFTKGTKEWEKTVKTCMLLGGAIGLIIGGIVLGNIIR